tara:strand:- start:25 stop:600 length:576 start_codon:yes stop_codon:yes gene_type:complete
MFALDGFENITNQVAQVQASDIKIFAGNKIRLSTEAMAKLNLTEGRNVLIMKNSKSGQVVIASVDEETKVGRAVNAKREFSHENIALSLGGHHSEWAITGEGQEHPATGDTYFELTETVHGADVVAELAAKVVAKTEGCPNHDAETEKEIAAETVVPAEAKESAEEASERARVLAEMEEGEELSMDATVEG